MGAHAKFIHSFSKNPWAWVFFVLFIIAERGNWQRGHDLTRVCSLMPHGLATSSNPVTPQQIIDMICADREAPDEPSPY